MKAPSPLGLLRVFLVTCLLLLLMQLGEPFVSAWAQGESSNTGGGDSRPTTNTAPKKPTTTNTQPPKTPPSSSNNTGGDGNSEEEAVGEDSENGARWGSLPRPEVLERPAVFRRQ